MHHVPVPWLSPQLGSERLEGILTSIGLIFGFSLGYFFWFLSGCEGAEVELEGVLRPRLRGGPAKVEVDVDVDKD